MAEKKQNKEVQKSKKTTNMSVLSSLASTKKKGAKAKPVEKVKKLVTVSAELKDALTSPQKARLVADLVRGMDVVPALDVLSLTQKKAAGIIRKAIVAGVASAQANNNLDKKDLVISRILVDEGVKFPRYRIVSRGQGHRYVRRRSRVRVELTEKNNR